MTDNVLDIYREHPMRDGDVVLLLEEPKLATEIEGLADHWDATIRRNMAHVLTEVGAGEVRVAIARPGSVLTPGDHALVADLQAELHGSGISVHPAIALPAA